MDMEDFVCSDEEEEDEAIDWESAGARFGSDESSAYEEDDAEEDDADEDEMTGSTASHEEAEAEEESKQAGEEETDLTAIDWARVSHELLTRHKQEVDGAKKAKKRKALTRRDRKRLTLLHQVHLMTLVHPLRQWNRLARDRLLQALMVSLVVSSRSTATSAAEGRPQQGTGGDFDFLNEAMQASHLVHWLQQLVRWFHTEFTLVLSPTRGGAQQSQEMEQQLVQSLGEELSAVDPEEAEMSSDTLMQSFYDRRGRHAELVLLFVSLCRGLGVDTRVTCALDAVQLNKTKQSILENALERRATTLRSSSSNGQRRRERKRPRRSPQGEETEEKQDEEQSSAEKTVDIGQWSYFPWIWAEVYDIKAMKWVHVDVIRKLVEDPHEVETLRGRTAPFSYVVSLDEDGGITDVTVRYVARWSVCRKLRLAETWWRDFLAEFNKKEQGSNRMTQQDRALKRKKEHESLQALEDKESMPTSLSGFKKHHLYCLEADLGQFEAIYPRKPVGIFKGKPVFPRANVVQLKPRWKWKREGREVREDELAKPFKTRRPKGSSDEQEQDDDEDDMSSAVNTSFEDGDPTQFARLLYGEWQTRAYEPPPVVDGRVPKNKYGNIEMWSDAFLPRGSRHIKLPRVERLAKQLGVDYAPAMVGYEVKQGRTYPKFDGIIVAEQNVELLQEAHAAIQQQTIEKAIENNRQLVYKRWVQLVKRLLLRQRLEDDYGKLGEK